MKTDAYTKAVLTVIAVCLILLVGKSSDSSLSSLVVPSAKAQGGTVMDVNIVGLDGRRLQSGTISLPVNISQINGEEFGKPANPYAAPSLNQKPSPALPVKITDK